MCHYSVFAHGNPGEHGFGLLRSKSGAVRAVKRPVLTAIMGLLGCRLSGSDMAGVSGTGP